MSGSVCSQPLSSDHASGWSRRGARSRRSFESVSFVRDMKGKPIRLLRHHRSESKKRVDFAGPLYVMQPGTGQVKVWIALYTCCVTRVLNLELVPDMTVATFLRSFKRFSARQGLPVSMISDNGRTFVAAAKEVDSIFSNPEVERYFNQRGIKWRFNVPRAPWWGGLFKRLVRSVKRCLRKNLSKARPTYEELLTALAEVEFILNSRPLTYVKSSDFEEPLTPSHLMYGRRIMNLPDCLIDDQDEEVDNESLNSQLKYLNHTINSFWKRWRKEYLLEAHRHFLSNGTPRIAVGDVVVVYAEGQPRSYWELGIIAKCWEVMAWCELLL